MRIALSTVVAMTIFLGAAPGHAGAEEAVLGIDLGTTNSVAYLVRDNKYRAVTTGQARDTNANVAQLWPSCISCDEKGQLITGMTATIFERNGHPTVRSSKRMVGRLYKDRTVQDLKSSLGYNVSAGVDDSEHPGSFAGRPALTLPCGEQALQETPEFFSGAILHGIRAAAEKSAGTCIKRAVITVPAYFDSAQKQATHDAARAAGLSVMRLIAEPTAAAVAHVQESLKGSLPREIRLPLRYVVFDFGGGTLDITVLHLEGSGIDHISVKAVGGNNFLGGEDIDDALAKYALSEFGKATDTKISASELAPHARSRLRYAVEMAKRDLSELPQTNVLNIANFHNGHSLDVPVTRSKFEKLVEPVLSQIKPLVHSTLKKAGLEADDIDRVLLVGGSCRIPRVRGILQEIFDGGNVLFEGLENVDTSVGLGAAHVAMSLLDQEQGKPSSTITLDDIVPRHLGIKVRCSSERDDSLFAMCGALSVKECKDRFPEACTGPELLREMIFDPIIKAGSRIPANFTKVYTPFFDQSTWVGVEVLVSDELLTLGKDTEEVDRLSIDVGTETQKASEKAFTVTFTVDANGILRVFARSKVSEKELHVGHALYRPKSQDEIKRLALLFQDRAAEKPCSTTPIDLADMSAVQTQLSLLLNGSIPMYDEAHAMLVEALEKATAEKREEDRAWLEWKLLQHSYLFGGGALPVPASSCTNEVLSDAQRMKDFTNMASKRTRKVDSEWWAKWMGLESLDKCTPAKLTQARRKKMLEYHPDKCSECKNGKGSQCDCCHQTAMRVTAAYDMLSPICA